ncbi:hypothetical protein AWB68_08024 [Caballeronia choica]|uniref:Pepco domain-containing protein n=1 Tax=Caballeronia choica TaxID=326476 RepID=A0A158KZ90_9BURK|nr:hypothetical protein AWB68_08024 [Caballeronia choica]
MSTSGVSSTITVICREDEIAGAKGLSNRISSVMQQVCPLNVSVVSQNMTRFCNAVAMALKDAELRDLPYPLDAVELTVELTGSGEVRLVGSVGAELSGGLKLTFKRG